MSTPRTNKFRLTVAALLLTLPAAPHAAARQTQDAETQPPRQQQQQQPPPSPEVERGRQLLEQGDAEAAAAALGPAAERDRADADAWHLLGVAYARRGKQQDALKALGSAVALRLDRLSFGPVPTPERFVKATPEALAASKARSLKLHGEALESVEEYLKLNPQDAELWRAQAAALKAHADFIASMENEYAGARPDSETARLVIQAKPEPGYTEEARRNGTDGRIRLRAIFGADGKVHHPLATRPLPHGLTGQAFEAARRIRFQPATIDGRPVSQFLVLEYAFALNVRMHGPLLGPRARPRIP